MQTVKKLWLSIYAYSLLLVDVLIFIAYLWFNRPGANPKEFEHWGITPLILAIALVHAFYILFVFPFVRKKSEKIASFISQAVFIFLMAAIIETSFYNNLTIRIGYAALVFTLSLTGTFVPIATVVATWVLFLYTYLSVLNSLAQGISIKFELIMNGIVTVAALLGWLFFRRYYIKTKDKETIALSRLLEQEQTKSSVMLESISDGVMVINTKGLVQVVNESATVMLGRKKNEVLRRDYAELLLGSSTSGSGTPETPADVVHMALTGKKSTHGVVLLQTKNKRQLFVDIVVSPIFETIETKLSEEVVTNTKSMVGVIAIIRDVDEQKRQEQQRSDFISTASHEMRTPVASMQGFLELALTPKIKRDPEKSFQYVEKAYQTSKQLGNLFTDLLVVSQHDQDSTSLRIETVDITTLIQEVIKQYEEPAHAKGITVSFKEPTEPQKRLYIKADRGKLIEVLQNLLQNALKYTEVGSISLSVQEKNDTIEIGISDTGIGIAVEDIPKLFKKFSRIDSSKTRTVGGTGLGLYIAKILTESMHGTIWVESTLGKGSTFYIELPKNNPGNS